MWTPFALGREAVVATIGRLLPPSPYLPLFAVPTSVVPRFLRSPYDLVKDGLTIPLPPFPFILMIL